MWFPSFPSASPQFLSVILLLFFYTVDASQTLNTTASGTDLQTWWHDNGEINFDTAVQEGNVRQSHIYSTWVSTDEDASNQTL